jgi:argininosuccinate lyase
VRHAEGRGAELADLTIDELRGFADAIGDDVYAVLTLEGSVASRDHEGGTAPSRVRGAANAALAAIAAEDAASSMTPSHSKESQP